ncbi:hypothetical protein AX16_008803 [Volvariella volvacea WC 439]|nr:hypothetical protein AX16_008803 [Volvariella volvacea WC 439]
MDPWPADERPLEFTGKGKGRRASRHNYPALALGNNLATLSQERNGELKWTSFIKEHNTATEQLNYQCADPVLLFPATRPAPTSTLDIPIQQRAEQGANFLRMHFPDVDVPSELIREELVEDAKLSKELDIFDPYAANLLELIRANDALFLTFPMGELNADLNVSPVRLSAGCLSFSPNAIAKKSFSSPIRQISSWTKADSYQATTYLAVRTYASTSVIDVQVDPVSLDISLVDLATFSRSNTGNKMIVDIGYSYSSPADVMFVTDCGGVYASDSSGKCERVCAAQPATEAPQDKFWRLASCEAAPNAILLASAKELFQYDKRSQGLSGILRMHAGKEFITSVKYSEHSVTLSTTRQLLFVDDRMPAKPLFGYYHGRQFDRSLDTQMIHQQDSSLILLTSRKNDLISIYDVTRSGGLMRLEASPYCLPAINGYGANCLGRAIVGPIDGCAATLFDLANNGSLYARTLFSIGQNEPSVQVKWSEEIMELKEHVEILTGGNTPLDLHEAAEIDFSSVYDRLSRRDPGFADQYEEEQASAVYDILEQIPQYWQREAASIDHMLTTYDITVRAGEEPQSQSRADFFSPNVINSKRGYRALTQSRLSADLLREHAGWYCDLRPSLCRLGIDIGDDPASLTKKLGEYDRVSNKELSTELVKRGIESRQQVALDLTLSSDVFAGQSFRNSKENLELENMTGALSLDGEPPSVEFSFLHPVPKDEKHMSQNGEEFVAPLGVRLLLRDWDVGADPKQYAYWDPYDTTSQAQSISEAKLPSTSHPSKPQSRPAIPSLQPSNVRTPLPPSILPSSQPPRVQEAPQKPALMNQSQVPKRTPQTPNSQPLVSDQRASGEVVASTQILPGPYGGRQTGVKKKPGKKRLGGF